MTAPDPHAQLAEIRAREQAATEGPWRALGTGVANGDHWYVCNEGEALAYIAANDGENEEQREPDAQFIAHSRTDMPRLLDALEAVLALHKPESYDEDWIDGGQAGYACYTCDDGTGHGFATYPCPTVRAITNVLGGGQ